jgi:S-adenosylmethionine decarboxylase
MVFMARSNCENGKHLVIDAYGCNNLNNKKYLIETITNVVKLIEMKILFPPKVVKGADHLPGLSAFCIIETSHVAIHTFTDNNKVSIDIYSCMDFDENKCINYFKERFGMNKIKLCKTVKRK